MTDQSANLPPLSPEDQALLDALVECGFEPDALDLNDEQRLRVKALMGLLGLLEDYPVEDPDETLVAATIARVDRADRDRRDRMTIQAEPSRPGLRIRIPDFITVAAVLLIAASIGLPLMHQLRQRSIDTRCANNMRMLGYAFGSYSADNNNHLPVASASLAGPWTLDARNAINLGPLVSGGYCEIGHMHCPGHEGTGNSYSYRWRASDQDLRWGQGRVMLILGDLNPLIDALRRGQTVSPLTVSANHGGRGQNVLSSDSSTIWLEAPVVGGGDNIWMPDGGSGLRNGVEPSKPGDVFLAQ